MCKKLGQKKEERKAFRKEKILGHMARMFQKFIMIFTKKIN